MVYCLHVVTIILVTNKGVKGSRVFFPGLCLFELNKKNEILSLELQAGLDKTSFLVQPYRYQTKQLCLQAKGALNTYKSY